MTPRQQAVFDQLCALPLRVEFGNPTVEDTCPLCGMVRKTGHHRFCGIGEAVRAIEELRSFEGRRAPKP